MPQSPELELREMIERGPLNDIFRADESRAIVEIVGANATAINASTFAPTFVALQSYAIEQFVMAITRMFDQPSKKYQLRSLPAIIAYVAKHGAALPIRLPTTVATALERLGSNVNATTISTQQLMTELNLRLPTSSNNAALEALKTLRDKRLAHAEHIDEIGATQWQLAEALLQTAKLLLGALGGVSNEEFLDSNGDYMPSADAGRAAFCTRRVLRTFDIGEPFPYEQDQ